MMHDLLMGARQEIASVLDKADDRWQHGIGSSGYDMPDGYFLMLADALLGAGDPIEQTVSDALDSVLAEYEGPPVSHEVIARVLDLAQTAVVAALADR